MAHFTEHLEPIQKALISVNKEEFHKTYFSFCRLRDGSFTEELESIQKDPSSVKQEELH